jgi:RNA polymerase sigma-70 factor, ECF subfamily
MFDRQILEGAEDEQPTARLTPAQEQWLGELYEAHAPAVQKLCWRILSNPQDAADACHEVFLRAARMEPQPNTRAWLLAVARNYCIDQIRRQKRFNTALTRIGPDSTPDVDPELSVVDRHTVDAIFRQLTKRERTVLWQTAVEHRPLAEIADRLHLNYMAAGQVVSRARKHASMLAARVAAVLILFRLITRRLSAFAYGGAARSNPSPSGGGLGWGLVAVVVPVVALSVQSSSPVTGPSAHLATQPAPAASHGRAPGAGRTSSKTTTTLPLPAGSLPMALPAPSVSAPALPVPSTVGGLAGSATNTVKKVIGTIPSPPALPAPSLSPPLPK